MKLTISKIQTTMNNKELLKINMLDLITYGKKNSIIISTIRTPKRSVNLPLLEIYKPLIKVPKKGSSHSFPFCQ